MRIISRFGKVPLLGGGTVSRRAWRKAVRAEIPPDEKDQRNAVLLALVKVGCIPERTEDLRTIMPMLPHRTAGLDAKSATRKLAMAQAKAEKVIDLCSKGSWAAVLDLLPGPLVDYYDPGGGDYALQLHEVAYARRVLPHVRDVPALDPRVLLRFEAEANPPLWEAVSQAKPKNAFYCDNMPNLRRLRGFCEEYAGNPIVPVLVQMMECQVGLMSDYLDRRDLPQDLAERSKTTYGTEPQALVEQARQFVPKGLAAPHPPVLWSELMRPSNHVNPEEAFARALFYGNINDQKVLAQEVGAPERPAFIVKVIGHYEQNYKRITADQVRNIVDVLRGHEVLEAEIELHKLASEFRRGKPVSGTELDAVLKQLNTFLPELRVFGAEGSVLDRVRDMVGAWEGWEEERIGDGERPAFASTLWILLQGVLRDDELTSIGDLAAIRPVPHIALSAGA